MYKNFKSSIVGVLVFSLAVSVVPLFAQQTGNIVGKVSAVADTTPVANATLILFQRGSGGQSVDPVDTTLTDNAGGYGFYELEAPENYFIAASASGFVPLIEKGINLQSNDTLRKDLFLEKLSNTNCGSIMGTVTDREDSTAIENAVLVLYFTEGSGGGGIQSKVGEAVPNANGFYEFELVVESEHYRLEASAPAYESGSQNRVAVTAGDTSTVDFRLRKESTDISSMNSVTNSKNSVQYINGAVICDLKTADNAVLTIFSASGKAIVRKDLITGYNSISIPKNMANQVVFASIKSGVKATYHRVVLP